jgi:hypothetical protein
MFSLNIILAWNINIIMNKKYDNNNIIIASRAYFLQDLSKVCKDFLALEEENQQLSAQLEDVRRKYRFDPSDTLFRGFCFLF